MFITIGSTSGPLFDTYATAEFDPEQLDIIKDVIAMVNKVSNNKEKWFVQTEDGRQYIPVTR